MIKVGILQDCASDFWAKYRLRVFVIYYSFVQTTYMDQYCGYAGLSHCNSVNSEIAEYSENSKTVEFADNVDLMKPLHLDLQFATKAQDFKKKFKLNSAEHEIFPIINVKMPTITFMNRKIAF